MYRHRQISYLLPVALLVPAIVTGALAWMQGPHWLFMIPIGLVLLTGLLSSLTIEVTDQELTSYFGPGIARKTVRRSDIVEVEPSSSSWFEGWGIRITARGVRLVSGERYRLGTDQREALLDALRSPSRVPDTTR